MIFAIAYWPVGLVLGLGGTALGAVARSEISRYRRLGGGQARAAVACGVIALVICAAAILARLLIDAS